MGRWEEDDFYIGRMTVLFADLTIQEKSLLCDVAEKMIEGRKIKEQARERKNDNG